jgi:response regulator of citrate/malate metabolism
VILCTAAAEDVRQLQPRLEELHVPVLIKPFEVADLDQVLRSELGDEGPARSA